MSRERDDDKGRDTATRTRAYGPSATQASAVHTSFVVVAGRDTPAFEARRNAVWKKRSDPSDVSTCVKAADISAPPAILV
jgi:hypothetical protein